MKEIPVDGSTRFRSADSPATHTVYRYYRDRPDTEVILRGLTLEQAKAHCQDPETSSETCTSAEGLARTAEHGPWMDGWRTDTD